MLVERVALGDRAHALGQLGLRGLERRRQRRRDDAPDLVEVVGLQAAGGQRAGADAQAAVTIGGRGSNGTALRLTVMPMSCRRSSACWPSSSDSRRSTSTRCTSVPPVRTLTPCAGREQLLGDAPWRRPPCAAGARGTARVAAILNATALPAMTCSSGPPCWPGKTAELISLAYSSLAEDQPAARAAERLVDVVVTTSAYGTGFGCTPAATRPGEVGHVDDQVARRPRRRSRGSARSPGSAGRRYQPARISFGLALAGRCAPPRPCRSGWSRASTS